MWKLDEDEMDFIHKLVYFISTESYDIKLQLYLRNFRCEDKIAYADSMYNIVYIIFVKGYKEKT